jgi:hypothetical protein
MIHNMKSHNICCVPPVSAIHVKKDSHTKYYFSMFKQRIPIATGEIEFPCQQRVVVSTIPGDLLKFFVQWYEPPQSPYRHRWT